MSGRGVGLDVVKEKAEELGGGIIINSALGEGCKIIMRLPITTALVQALLVRAMNAVFAVPIASVIEIIVVEEKDIKKIEDEETILHRGNVLPIMRMEKIFQVLSHKSQVTSNVEQGKAKLKVVILEFNNNHFGIVVDELLSQQDIVIKQMTKELKGVRGFAGATILGDGSVALVLDVATLI